MNSYRAYGQLDDQPQILGDSGFTKLDMLTDPAVLPPGSLAVCENMRFDANGTTVRAGLSRQFPAGSVISQAFGVCVFKPSADEDYLAFATGSLLVIFNLQSQVFQFFDYPDNETIEDSDSVDMVQGGVGSGTLPQLYILRGEGKDALLYDSNLGTVVTDSDFARGNTVLFYQDRMAVAQAQGVEVSNFLDFTIFTLLNQFQILLGGDDYLKCLVQYQKDYVLIGSQQGWFLAYFAPQIGVNGYAFGLNSQDSFLRNLTRQAGPVGPRAALEAQGLIWFITSGAIYAFTPQLDNQLTMLGKPISAEIQPIMDRMSLRYASRACVERYGYRLYFALPISDEALPVDNITVTYKVTAGLVLPFTLPTFLSTNALATLTTDEPHNLVPGSRVQITGSVDAGLNGEFSVFSVLDNYNFQLLLNIATSATFGNRVKMQRLATRNNCVAVFNLNNQAWESIDWLPDNLFADWLRSVEQASQRRLMMIDQDAGPLLYEDGDADEVGDITGGITLPFTLPVTLSAVNFVTKPIAGRIVTRCYRWGIPARKVTRCEVRSTFDDITTLTLTLYARNPSYRLWQASRNYKATDFSTTDVPLRKMCGERAIEGQVEILTTGGRPTFRSVALETLMVGKPEE